MSRVLPPGGFLRNFPADPMGERRRKKEPEHERGCRPLDPNRAARHHEVVPRTHWRKPEGGGRLGNRGLSLAAVFTRRADSSSSPAGMGSVEDSRDSANKSSGVNGG